MLLCTFLIFVFLYCQYQFSSLTHMGIFIQALLFKIVTSESLSPSPTPSHAHLLKILRYFWNLFYGILRANLSWVSCLFENYTHHFLIISDPIILITPPTAPQDSTTSPCHYVSSVSLNNSRNSISSARTHTDVGPSTKVYAQPRQKLLSFLWQLSINELPILPLLRVESQEPSPIHDGRLPDLVSTAIMRSRIQQTCHAQKV